MLVSLLSNLRKRMARANAQRQQEYDELENWLHSVAYTRREAR
jgi:hypothetical protein